MQLSASGSPYEYGEHVVYAAEIQCHDNLKLSGSCEDIVEAVERGGRDYINIFSVMLLRAFLA